MTTRYRKLWIIVAAILTIVAAVVVLALLLLGGPPNTVPLPNPNGYEGLVAAGREVPADVAGFRDLDHSSLQKLVADGAESLLLLRTSLKQQSRLPLETFLDNMQGLLAEMSGLKHLAQLLAAEGRLYELDNQWGQAAGSYTDAIQLGNEMSRGGLLITRLVGVACEGIGYQGLTGVVPKLTTADNANILNRLKAIDTGRISWTEVMQNEKRCARHHLRQHPNPVTWLMSWWNTRGAVQKAELRNKTAIAHERLLLAELSLRCYRAETGHAPVSLDALVPKYLPNLPADPFHDRPLTYQRQAGTNWLLYSVGPDGVDNHGQALARGPEAKGDIRSDSSR